jgi:pyruvate dehydrogenase E2 component (dihydrolipoamide acetyltransferase)
MTVEYKFPDLGEGVTEGEIKKWLVKEGDEVQRDQALAEVETDKAVVEMPSPVAGKVLRLYHKDGDVVKVGEVLAVIGQEGEVVAAAEAPAKRESVSVVGELPREEITVSSQTAALPSVRRLAKELGVDLATVKGTGKEGRVSEDDVRAAAAKTDIRETPPEAARPRAAPKFDLYGFIDRVPMKGVRRTTAKHMLESQAKTAAVTAMEQVDVTDLVALRERVKKAAQETRGIKVTYMPFIVKAVVTALKAHPLLNASIDDETEELLVKKYYNIGVAVAIEDGLIVPVVKGADQKGILDLADEVQKMAELAKQRKLDLADLKGGTFTITNYGVFGSTYGTPIINYPEVAILGVGRIFDAPLIVQGEVRARKVLPLSLTFDHRALDGAEAARFINDLKKLLENPDLIPLIT